MDDSLKSTEAINSYLKRHSERMVIWTKFEQGLEWNILDNSGGRKVKYILILGYPNGFSIWDISSSNDHLLIDEVISVRSQSQYISIISLPSPLPSLADDRYMDSRPLLLVLETVLPSSTIPRIYSLVSKSFVHDLFIPPKYSGNVGSAALCASASTRFIVVSYLTPSSTSNDHYLHIFKNGEDFAYFKTISDCYPSPNTGISVFTLGRWIAYASSSEPPQNKCIADASSAPFDDIGNVKKLAKDSATYIKDTVKQYGGTAVKSASKWLSQGFQSFADTYLNSSNPGESNTASRSQPDDKDQEEDYTDPLVSSLQKYNSELLKNSSPGVVVVLDLVTSKVLAHWRAHTHAIHYLSFDPSGMLLASTSVEGYTIVIWDILPPLLPFGPQFYNSAHISNSDLDTPFYKTSNVVRKYKLHRGYTTAHIEDISWGNNSWLAATTTRGTAHVWVLNSSRSTAHQKNLNSLIPRRSITMNSADTRVYLKVSSSRKGVSTPLSQKSHVHFTPTFASLEQSQMSRIPLENSVESLLEGYIWRKFGNFKSLIIIDENEEVKICVINPRSINPSRESEKEYCLLTDNQKKQNDMFLDTAACLTTHKVIQKENGQFNIESLESKIVGRDLTSIGTPFFCTINNRPQSRRYSIFGTPEKNEKNWISQIEVKTCLEIEPNPLLLNINTTNLEECITSKEMWRPLWSGPQFKFKVFTEGTTFHGSSCFFKGPIKGLECEDLIPENNENIIKDIKHAMEDKLNENI